MSFWKFSLCTLFLSGVFAYPGGTPFMNDMEKRVLTPDNTCGGTNGYTCNPALAQGGPCCSKNGYCGTGTTYCNAGCQWDYSDVTKGCNASAPSVNTCGGANGYSCNPSNVPGAGACCSASGYCGSTSAYCSVANGCQSSYGRCYGPSTPASHNGANWTIGNVGTFTYRSIWNFSTMANMPAGQMPFGLVASNYPTSDTVHNSNAKYNKTFVPTLAQVSGGYLNLVVPGNQNKSPIQCAEVSTCQESMLFGSVRVVARMATPDGVCNGNFYYQEPYVTNNQEIDYEYLTNISSTSNTGSNNPSSRSLFYTNYGSDGTKWTTNVSAPNDAQTNLHEYRVDWVKGKVTWFLDGVETAYTTADVPSTSGSWIWNNWSNGDPGWSVGPPKTNATFQIQSVVMFWNSTSPVALNQQCPILYN